MRALLLGAVAIGARFLNGSTPVRFMTISADLVPLGRGPLLSAVAAGAGCCLRSRMRFVAPRAARVTGFHQAGLALMASVARDFIGLWMVR